MGGAEGRFLRAEAAVDSRIEDFREESRTEVVDMWWRSYCKGREASQLEAKILHNNSKLEGSGEVLGWRLPRCWLQRSNQEPLACSEGAGSKIFQCRNPLVNGTWAFWIGEGGISRSSIWAHTFIMTEWLKEILLSEGRTRCLGKLERYNHRAEAGNCHWNSNVGFCELPEEMRPERAK